MDKKTSIPVDKENLIQAVVVADIYNDNFCPSSNSIPACLMPLANRPMLDYTLECLSAAGVQEVILFCSMYADQIKEFVRKGNWGSMVLNVIVSEGCRSFGDAMRDLDAKALIRTDFILLSGTVVGSLNLIPILEKHKKLQKTDKGAAMTVLYKDCGNKTLHPNDELYLAIDNKTDQILFHSRRKSYSAIDMALDSKIDVPLEVVLERSCLDFRCNLLDTGVSVCSVTVPPLFSDNFDFQTREDFIRGLLMNEEILASTLYAHILSTSQYAAEVSHWHNYHSICRDIIHRWTYPQVPGGFIDEMYSYRFGNIYLQNGVSMETGSKLIEDVVIGQGSSIGAKTKISSSVVGKCCRISSDVIINNSHIFSNVTIEAGSIIEYCVVGAGCVIKSGARVKSSVLGPGVVVPSEKCVDKLRLQSTPLNKDDDDGISDKAFEYKLEDNEDVASQDSSSEGSNPYGGSKVEWISLDPISPLDWLQFEDYQSDDGETQSARSSQPDDTNLFFSEVVDSLTRGLEDKLPCDNLVLEVNSSRYAYNVSLREVNYHVSRAVLSLHPSGSKWDALKSTVDYFMPLLSNYIKNPDAMSDCLSAIEDVSESKEEVRVLIVKLLNYFYDNDLLSEDSILDWHLNPRDNSSFSTLLRKQVMPFIKWLQEADEQSDSDD